MKNKILVRDLKEGDLLENKSSRVKFIILKLRANKFEVTCEYFVLGSKYIMKSGFLGEPKDIIKRFYRFIS